MSVKEFIFNIKTLHVMHHVTSHQFAIFTL